MNINDIRSKKETLKVELSYYLSNPKEYQKEITATRGRLLRILNQELKLETDLDVKASIQEEINTEIKRHKEQLKTRISTNKQTDDLFLIQNAKELGLKFKKLSTNIKAINNSKTRNEKAANGMKVAGDILSIAGSIAKVPIVATINLGEKIAPILGKIIVQPIQIPAFLFSKIIVPDSKYNGKAITNFGNFLGNGLSEILNIVEKGVKRM